jgi:hypothetical protein
MTALAAYALVAAGVPREHPSVARALAYLDVHRPAKTYELGCHMMLLAALHDPARRRELEGFSIDLAEMQDATGLWSYRGGRYDRGGQGDFSNTQYAALGLLAARKAGVAVPVEVVRKLAFGTVDALIPVGGAEAGLPYRPSEARPDVSGTMVTAGLGILGFCRGELAGRLTEAEARRIDGAIARLAAWLAARFSVETPPQAQKGWRGYFLYGIERLGALLPLERIGEHDWYAEGAELLLRGSPDRLAEVDAAFAILFLVRATAATSAPTDPEAFRSAASPEEDEVRLGVSGEAPAAFWIQGFRADVRARFERGDPPGLRIKRVDYVVDGLPVGSVRGDPTKPWTTERFPMRHHFDRPGPHWIAVRLQVAGRGEAVLASRPLRYEVRVATPEFLWGYPRDAQRNELLRTSVTARATSALRDRMRPADACDGSQATAWLCAAGDEAPTLTLVLDPPALARRVLLSQPNASEADRARYDQARELVVHVAAADGSGASEHVVRAPENELEKAVLDLGGPRRVGRIDVLLRDRRAGTRQPGVAGLAEVELVAEP